MILKLLLSVGLAALVTCAAPAYAQDKTSQKFIKEAIEGNLAEVQIGQLAQQKGQSDGVKSFGQLLATDHGTVATDMEFRMGGLAACGGGSIVRKTLRSVLNQRQEVPNDR